MNSPSPKSVATYRACGPGFRFGLGTLMLLMTLVSVCFALMATSPVLGIGFAVLSAPATIRTSYVSARRRQAGRPMRLSECLGEFTLGLVFSSLTVIGPLVAFLATCLLLAFAGHSLGLSASLFFVVWGAGGVAAALVLIWIVWKVWPMRYFRCDDMPPELTPELLRSLATLPETEPGANAVAPHRAHGNEQRENAGPPELT